MCKEDRFRDVVESSPDGVVMLDREGRFVYLNREAEWRATAERIHPDDRAGVQRDREASFGGTEEHHEAEYRFRVADGSHRWLVDFGRITERDEAGYARRIVGVVQDVTGRKGLEAQFREAQKMEAKVVDLGEVVAGTETMFRRLIGEDLDLRVDVEAGLPPVRVDPGHVEQVVMNLVVNARDAVSERGGSIRVRVRRCCAKGGSSGVRGEWVVIEVEDDGSGMDRSTKERIFEPFFTTKGEGRGTGLGLSTVYGIVRQSRGWIDVDTEPGAGSDFTVGFPVVEHEGAGESHGAGGSGTGSSDGEAGARSSSSRTRRPSGGWPGVSWSGKGTGSSTRPTPPRRWRPSPRPRSGRSTSC